MEETVGKKPASRFLFRFVPAGVCVLECVFLWTWTLVCTSIFKWSNFCFSVVVCIFVPICKVLVSASEMNAFLGCGITYPATRFPDYLKYPFSVGQFAWLKHTMILLWCPLWCPGEDTNLVASKTGSVLRMLLRLELGSEGNTIVLLQWLFHWLGLEPLGLIWWHLWCRQPVARRKLLEADALHSSEWWWVGCVPPAPGTAGETLLLLAAVGVFLAPVAGQSWGLAFTSCWGGFRTPTLNSSLCVLRIYIMCEKCLEVVCYLPLFFLSTKKLKWLCPFGNNEWFVRIVY